MKRVDLPIRIDGINPVEFWASNGDIMRWNNGNPSKAELKWLRNLRSKGYHCIMVRVPDDVYTLFRIEQDLYRKNFRDVMREMIEWYSQKLAKKIFKYKLNGQVGK